ncbi:MAG: aldo/keto reductase [Actinomycetota bacterium]|nr:aldo/keto reductase [Actinomycetota bacterium]
MTSSLVDASPRRLGSLGDVGPLGLGQWRFTTDDLTAATALVEAAIDAGLNLVDTADVYGLDFGGTGFGACEELLGRVLAGTPSMRQRMVLATKAGIAPPTPYDSSPNALTAACEASLTRLGVDVIDLYQIHRPDMLTHPADVAATLGALRSSGKIREVGVSNHTPAQVDALAAHLPFPLVTNQPEYSAAHLDPLRDGTFDACMRLGLVPLVWSPLGGGSLATGEGVRPELLAVLDGLAERKGTDRATVALAFALAHPSRPVAIVGTQRPERVTASLAALDVQLDRADVYAVIQASEGQPLP